MARKEATFVADFGRDAGKQFHITEMSATQAENWAIKLILSIGSSGIEIPDNLAAQGMAGLLAVGYLNILKIPFEDARPLLDEMMECVQAVPSHNVKRFLIEDDIEEVKTRLSLRKAVWDLHMDFFLEENKSISESNHQNITIGSSNIKPRQRR